MTALSCTAGTGNIAGVATIIALGGPASQGSVRTGKPGSGLLPVKKHQEGWEEQEIGEERKG